jgi:hypothetical protein
MIRVCGSTRLRLFAPAGTVSPLSTRRTACAIARSTRGREVSSCRAKRRADGSGRSRNAAPTRTAWTCVFLAIAISRA